MARFKSEYEKTKTAENTLELQIGMRIMRKATDKMAYYK